MSLDLKLFADKLHRYIKQFEIRVEELSERTGIDLERLHLLLRGEQTPSGDEILILADCFRCDFRFFISNERFAAFEQTEELFRSNSDILRREDRHNIKDFLFLCECQDFLYKQMDSFKEHTEFSFSKEGNYYKRHGIDAAAKLRRELGYSDIEIPRDIFEEFRRIGIHIFRRNMGRSSVSGVYIRHPEAGRCILVNYDEDVYRQRFSVAHEVGHVLLDDDDVRISSDRDTNGEPSNRHKKLSEVRADAFASAYLAPESYLKSIPDSKNWDEDKIVHYSSLMMINPPVLAIALHNCNLISEKEKDCYLKVRIPKNIKKESELSSSLSSGGRRRKLHFLQKGLSESYVALCIRAYREKVISLGRLSEVLLCDDVLDLKDIFESYNVSAFNVD